MMRQMRKALHSLVKGGGVICIKGASARLVLLIVSHRWQPAGEKSSNLTYDVIRFLIWKKTNYIFKSSLFTGHFF